MLLIESRIADGIVDGRGRLALLDALQDRGLVPLIRTSRLYCFEQALSGAERASELERVVSAWADAQGDTPLVRGDLFCFEDFVHFLIFADDGAGLRAGIVYNAETDEPLQKLDAFCRNVLEALEDSAQKSGTQATTQTGLPPLIRWRKREGSGSENLARFAAGRNDGANAPQVAVHGAQATEHSRALEILEDAGARQFLQRLNEAHAEGRVADRLTGNINDPAQESMITRLAGAGLVRRELLVSCRKDGRSLFRLPSPDALAIMTASNAVCTECGSAVADERAEELVTPTPIASSMLKDGTWLVSGLRSSLVGLGLPAGEIAFRPASAGMEAQMLANVCGEQFLFVLRDGDFNNAGARRALDAGAEVNAAHLVVVTTGKIQEEARMRLREHARRRSRTGGDVEVITIEGFERAASELRETLEKVSQRALTRELYELDASLGFDAGQMVAARFGLMQKNGALRDLAASAAGALAGSLREL